ncbi:MAG: hypothetical protein PHC68_00375 [Syntrophorhabdaceae bacterium]|nr:hypothetical protein [Syntrophorhabdaceae bacterium]
MKIKALLFALIVFFSASVAIADDTRKVWYATSLTGGGVGALDAVVSGVSMGPYDTAITMSGASIYIHRVTLNGGTESSPYLITPDDVGAAVSRWELATIFASGFQLAPMSIAPTRDGQIAYHSPSKSLTIGDGTNTRSIESTYGVDITILSPGSQTAKNSMPLFTNGGTTLYITGATIFASESGVTIEGIVSSVSEYNTQYGSGSTIFNYLSIDTTGTGTYYKTFLAGTTTIPPRRTVLMDFGIKTPSWIRLIFEGYLEGNKK